MTWLRRLVRRGARGPHQRSLEERAQLDFGDTVRVRDTQVTQQAGLVGRSGIVAGLTTPSAGYAPKLLGDPVEDVAVNVHFEDGVSRWLAPQLLELVDHTAGLTVGIAGATFERTADGEWRGTDSKPS